MGDQQENVSSNNRGSMKKQDKNESRPTTAHDLIRLLTDGAKLSYAELARSPPQPVPEEEFCPIIHRGRLAADDDIKVLLPSPCVEQEAYPVPSNFLIRDVREVHHAYAILPTKKDILLRHDDKTWGRVKFGAIYERVKTENGALTFRAPSDAPSYVAIKMISLGALIPYLQNGGNENPYREIARMQELGDGRHVLPCVEALQDDEYLYIITPRACNECGTLNDFIGNVVAPGNCEPSRIHSIWVQILEILLYLESHSICHRDLSPDNFLFLTPDNLVVFDLAMSVRIPSVPESEAVLGGLANRSPHRNTHAPRRPPILPHGNFGKPAYMAPEVFRNKVYDGVGVDLWSATLVLYNLLTTKRLYEYPHHADMCFLFFLLAGGLSTVESGEHAAEALDDVFERNDQKGLGYQSAVVDRAVTHLSLDDHALQLLLNVLNPDPSKRWNLEQVVLSDFVQTPGH